MAVYYKQEGLDIGDMSIGNLTDIDYSKSKIKDPKERFKVSFISTLKTLNNNIKDNNIRYYLNTYINKYGDLYIKTSPKTAATAFAIFELNIQNEQEFKNKLNEYTNKLSQNINKQIKINNEFLNYLKIDILRYYKIISNMMDKK